MRCTFYGNEMKKTRAVDFSRVTQITALLFPLDSIHRILTVSSSSPRNQASNSENPLSLMILSPFGPPAMVADFKDFIIFARKPSVQYWESSELDDSRLFLSHARRPLLGISINLRVSPEIPKCATAGIVDDGEFKAVIRSWIILRDAKLPSVAANLAGNGYLSCNLLTWGIGEAFCCNKIGWFAALLCSYARKFQFFASKQLPTKRLVGKPSGNYV